jgi:hypothetical protein
MTAAASVCEITADGYLRLPAELAERCFPAGVCVASVVAGDLVLLPLRSEANGGLVLKRRNAAGDRSLLINEVLAFRPPAGRFEAAWDGDRGALVVALRDQHGEGASGGSDGAGGGRGGAGAVGRHPAADRSGGHRAPAPVGIPDRARGDARGLHAAAGGASPAGAAAGRGVGAGVAS